MNQKISPGLVVGLVLVAAALSHFAAAVSAASFRLNASAQEAEVEKKDGKKDEKKSSLPSEPTFDKSNPATYGKQIAEYKDQVDQGWVDEISQGSMTLFDADGDSVRRTFTRMVYERVKEGDKIIIKFSTPAEIKGVTALTHENPGSTDDNWLYLPSNKRVRRISGANNTASFQGTEFTYEDLANLDPREYDWRFLEETELDRGGKKIPVYKVEAKPTYKDTGYSRLLIYVHRDHWRQERAEFFDLAGKHLKTRDSTGWNHIHGRFWREKNLEMTNHQTGKKTVLDQQRQFLDLSRYKSKKTGKPRKGLKESFFTTRAIQS